MLAVMLLTPCFASDGTDLADVVEQQTQHITEIHIKLAEAFPVVVPCPPPLSIGDIEDKSK